MRDPSLLKASLQDQEYSRPCCEGGNLRNQLMAEAWSAPWELAHATLLTQHDGLCTSLTHEIKAEILKCAVCSSGHWSVLYFVFLASLEKEDWIISETRNRDEGPIQLTDNEAWFDH